MVREWVGVCVCVIRDMEANRTLSASSASAPHYPAMSWHTSSDSRILHKIQVTETSSSGTVSAYLPTYLGTYVSTDHKSCDHSNDSMQKLVLQYTTMQSPSLTGFEILPRG